ncbi:MAG: PH domain-containing protein [Gordonia sp. (in: high G+C Gram-positive bacteria)]|uniref:PH domain-containing protein n=1 Tax=Gordonia sp. (in: high G+C Gram-positive bacteria) TaxID=84139 RepID=UPI0039E35D64
MSAAADRSTDRKPADDWEYVYRPKAVRKIVGAAVAVVIVIHVTFGLLLDHSYTGVTIDWADKLSLIGVGVVICGALLLLVRPRLRFGPQGVGVLNLVTERVYGWDDVVGMDYPDKAQWARLLFPYDEHIPVMAIQARDGEAAVAAMRSFREYREKYATRTR